MPRNQWERPSKEAMERGVREHGTVTAYARSIMVPRNTVAHWAEDYGIRAGRASVERAALGSQVSRAEILEQENAELRAALRGERKGEVKRERLISAIERALESVDPPKPLDMRWKPSGKGTAPHHRALFLLSDAHGGEIVKPAGVNGLNRYDWSIMHERHQELLESFVSHVRRMPPLSGVDLLVLGDNCSGANHRELEVTNEYPLAKQGILYGYLLGEFVTKIASVVPNVMVKSVPGNHPRLTEKPAAKDVDDNMDVVATVLGEERTRHLPNVSWTQPEGAAIFHEIAGRLCYVFHGDGIRSSMPGVPWGGVIRRANTIQAGHSRHIHHFIHGHYHQANVVQAGRIIGNGSVKGVDEWVLKMFGGGDPPTQLLVLFDERGERMTDVKYLTPTAGLPERDA